MTKYCFAEPASSEPSAFISFIAQGMSCAGAALNALDTCIAVTELPVLEIVLVSTLLFGFQFNTNTFPLSSTAFEASALVSIVTKLPPTVADGI